VLKNIAYIVAFLTLCGVAVGYTNYEIKQRAAAAKEAEQTEMRHLSGTVVKIVSTLPTVVNKPFSLTSRRASFMSSGHTGVSGESAVVGEPTYVIHVTTDKGLYVVEIMPGVFSASPQTITSLASIITEGTKVEFPIEFTQSWRPREVRQYFTSSGSGPAIGRIPPYAIKVLSTN
jgi:hypothetical protein